VAVVFQMWTWFFCELSVFETPAIVPELPASSIPASALPSAHRPAVH